jgi:hypothetical protein
MHLKYIVFMVLSLVEAKDMRDMSKITANKIELTGSDFKPKRPNGDKYEAYMTILESNGKLGQQFYIPDDLSIGR